MNLEHTDTKLLVDEAIKDFGNIRKIVFLHYDEDVTIRFTAAKALGEIAKQDPVFMAQRRVRIFMAFYDTMSCLK